MLLAGFRPIRSERNESYLILPGRAYVGGAVQS